MEGIYSETFHLLQETTIILIPDNWRGEADDYQKKFSVFNDVIIIFAQRYKLRNIIQLAADTLLSSENYNSCTSTKVVTDIRFELYLSNPTKLLTVINKGAQISCNAWSNGIVVPIKRRDFQSKHVFIALLEQYVPRTTTSRSRSGKILPLKNTRISMPRSLGIQRFTSDAPGSLECSFILQYAQT